MKRTTFKYLWLATVFFLLISSFFVYRQSLSMQSDIDRASMRLEQLKRDLRASEQLSIDLAALDDLTMNEKNATKLDVLRHLGLAESNYKYNGGSRSERRLGNTRLYIRRFTLQGEDTYEQVINQLNVLNDNQKVSLHGFTLAPGKGYGDTVAFSAEARFYALDKKE